MNEDAATPQITKVSESMLTIINPSADWKYGQVIQVGEAGDQLAVVMSL
jgi:hypothetical protein